jgi:hypothetical protein
LDDPVEPNLLSRWHSIYFVAKDVRLMFFAVISPSREILITSLTKSGVRTGLLQA